MAFTVVDGFPFDQRDIAARLFWDAFRGKLNPVLKPESKALRFLSAVADPDYAISALTQEQTLIGVAGFKTGSGSFIGGDLKSLRQTYGTIGAVWRGLVLSLLERPVQAGTLLMDGIFVSEAARGQGVGTALLEAIKQKAIVKRCSKVRLDVIDTNPRARALYERRGFNPVGTTSIGPLRHVFGFRSATTMICEL